MPEIRIAPDRRHWAEEAATLLHQLTDRAISSRGCCLLTLSGGSTPKTLYDTLTTPEWKHRFTWERIFFLFGDERCVPPDHQESNYGMARAVLFEPLGISHDRIYRMQGEMQDPETAAREYEETLRALTRCRAPAVPQLDVVLLGLGEDGHTASLFPGTAALHNRTRLVAPGQAPAGVSSRLTLTLGVINRASVVVFLVTGTAKAPVVGRVLHPRSEADRQLPAALVNPSDGRLIWMLDQQAATHVIGADERKGTV
jgi:6-phosphogluconolactonase